MRLCPCGSDTKAVLYETPIVSPDGCNLDPFVRVVECSTCGFVFSDTNANQKDYDEYYASQDMYAEPNKDFSKHVNDIYDFCKNMSEIRSSTLVVGAVSFYVF